MGRDPLEPPARLSPRGQVAWREVVAAHGAAAADVVGPELELYAEAVGRAREAHERVAAEGMITADPRGAPMSHPALAIAAAAEKTIARLGPRFQVRVSRRDRGYMAKATAASVRAAGLDDDERFDGAVAAVMTLALVIDEAQAQGRDALTRAAFGPIPSYLKAVRDLGLVPSVSVVEAPESSGGAEVSDLDAWRSAREG